jgi:anionic cell wall polymer biosynthesis LytR-Cps2A-Psr (LCP) family protein
MDFNTKKIKKKLLARPRLFWMMVGLTSFLFFVFLSSFLFLNSLPGKLALIYFNQPTTNLANTNGRTNIVVLGLGGEGNQVKDLTDTIIFVSLSHRGEETLMLSLPRDLWLESMKAKINTAYHYGGIDLVKSSIEEVLGQEVHDVFLVDFDGFKEVIDLLGGLEINIENGFDDYWFPIPGKENDPCDGDPEYKCRYEHLHFDAGWQVLNGEIALKYVRSRNAEGDEGTDFARAKRQQNLFLALKNNLLTSKVLLDPHKLQGLWQIVQKSFTTDIQLEEYPLWAKLLLQFEREKINNQVLNGEQGLLYHPQIHYSGQWVMLPLDPSWQKIHEFIEKLIEERAD